MATPIFEFTDVFQRTLGDTSDIVTKEMYTFEDKGGDSLTLRPEGTAGIARAFISGGLQNELPLKCFYHGPMFRHERPQKGRLRQFHQIGVELIGVAEPPVMWRSLPPRLIRWTRWESFPARPWNSTRSATVSRDRYRAVLVEYFNAHLGSLSQDSQGAADTESDAHSGSCKSPEDREIVASALSSTIT